MVGFISLADAKRHLQVEHDEDNDLIAGYIAAAGAYIEAETGHACPARAETFRFDGFSRQLILPLRPVSAEGVEVSYLDGAGDTLAFAAVRLFEKSGQTRIMPARAARWPRAACAPSSVTVSALVGWAPATDAAQASCPGSLIQAARLLVGHWYANREAVDTGNTASPIPLGVSSLLRPERLVKV